MEDFQDSILLTSAQSIQSCESALLSLNRLYKLRRGYKIDAVGYSTVSKLLLAITRIELLFLYIFTKIQTWAFRS
jgi:hypothetical protein